MEVKLPDIEEDLLIDQILFKSSHTEYGINQIIEREYNDTSRIEALLNMADKMGIEIEEDWISGHTKIDENHRHYWYPYDVEHDEPDDFRAWYYCNGRDCPYERYIHIRMNSHELSRPTMDYEQVWDKNTSLCAGGTLENPCRKDHNDCNFYHSSFIGWRCDHDYDWKEYRIDDRFTQLDQDLTFLLFSECSKCNDKQQKKWIIKQDVIPDLQSPHADHVHKWEWEDYLERDENNDVKLNVVVVRYSCKIEGCSVQDREMRLPLGRPKISRY